MGLSFPRIEATGNYEVTGNVLLFPVRSKGDFWAVFCEYHLHSTVAPNSSFTIHMNVNLIFSGRSSAGGLWVGVANSVPPLTHQSKWYNTLWTARQEGAVSPKPAPSSPVGKQYKIITGPCRVHKAVNIYGL